MSGVRKQQFPSACEKIIFSFSDSLLNGNVGEYIFMVCEQASLDFTPKQQTVVIRTAYCLWVPGFHFHSWKKVVAFIVCIRPSPPVLIYRQGCCCTMSLVCVEFKEKKLLL